MSFFESSPVDYAKYLINLKNTRENKEFVIEARNRTSALKDRIRKMSETEKKKKKEKRRWDIKDYWRNSSLW